MRKKASVRRTFYRSFCLLIVLPLVAVAAAGSALLYRKLLADAREMVQMRQEAVSSALTQDVRQASLQLGAFPSFRRQRGPCSGWTNLPGVVQPPV